MVCSVDVPGPHQDRERSQWSVLGRSVEHGGAATLMVIRSLRYPGVSGVYLHGHPRQAILVDDGVFLGLIREVTTEIRVCAACGGSGVCPPASLLLPPK